MPARARPISALHAYGHFTTATACHTCHSMAGCLYCIININPAMKFRHSLVSGLFLLLKAARVLASPAPVAHSEIMTRSISTVLYDDLVRYTKYASAAYQLACPSPLGNHLVQSFSQGSTQGFVARDDNRREIVVSFRGTSSLADAITDLNLVLTPLATPGINKPFSVHSGFLNAYNDVARIVINSVGTQASQFSQGYSLIVTGHSLGGALAALGAVSLKTAFPKVPMKLYTFGQPRTGDAQWAKYIESLVGVDNIFRAVHTFDGVPTIVAPGFQHHATQYWQSHDPIPLLESAESTVTRCIGEEDPACSNIIPSTGINPAHVFYFGQVMAVNPLLCV
ncbi:Lipase-3 domain-containing protein [Mycena indigotica]|uniref:Lipase-3 domain-containing protein n=1 Tax=Mycena indigotica TaxID=2126181 RepID=A0A8H6WAN1_9AGAR|nr:Lipase-3 domain-containing protein [Mycena indigotica]KAF7311759.1 Lipase-3 domain-containing protein [Mycena indigotica]